MPPLRSSILGLALLAMACAPGSRVTRRDDLPPPAPAIRAGARDPGAGPVSGSGASAASLPPARPAPQVHGRRGPSQHDRAVQQAIETAAALVGKHEIVVGGTRWGDGCAALVRAAYAEAGAPLPPRALDARALHTFAKERTGLRRVRPAPGDLVFLADRPGGPPEHVGLVEAVGPDGTALVLHQTEHGVLRMRVNGTHPWMLKSPEGRAVNDRLVVGGGRVPAGRLLVAYATLL